MKVLLAILCCLGMHGHYGHRTLTTGHVASTRTGRSRYVALVRCNGCGRAYVVPAK